MPTFQSSKVATTVMARAGIDATTQTATYTIPSGFATNDVVEMVKIPAGATVINVILSSSAGVGATANLAVGDGGDTDRHITSTAYTAAALTRTNAHTGHGYLYTAEDTIDILAVSIATPTVGTVVRLTVEYQMQS
jgi:hypothetical protein